MMVTIKDLRTGELHSGQTPESIARREYGRGVEVRYSADPNNRGAAMVLRRMPRETATWRVLTDLIVYP